MLCKLPSPQSAFKGTAIQSHHNYQKQIHGCGFNFTSIKNNVKGVGAVHGNAETAVEEVKEIASSRSSNGYIKDQNEVRIPLTQKSTATSLLLFLPGTDGTSAGLQPHIPALETQGWDVHALYYSPYKTPSWQDLTDECVSVLERQRDTYNNICLTCESFGACLGLRVALQRPDLIDQLVLINSATAFDNGQLGVPMLFAQSNLLQFFPQQLYDVAQAILVPFMINPSKIRQGNTQQIRQIMHMEAQLDKNVYINLDENDDQKFQQNGRIVNSVNSVNGSNGSVEDEFYRPAYAGSHRLKLLLQGNLTDDEISRIQTKTLIVCSANDDLLNSVKEGSRLSKLIHNSQKIILPNCYHTPLLEQDVSLAQILSRGNFLPPAATPSLPPAPNNHTPDEEMRARWETAQQNLLPFRRLLSPVVLGEENIPDRSILGSRPILFVGNHSMYGFMDTFLMSLELNLYGIQTTGLAHPGHWLGPMGPIFESFGAIRAYPITVFKALKENKTMLLFPGGAREVNKRKGESYQLFWDEQPNLVRLAAKAGALVVPFSIVGIDDAFDIFMGPDQILDDQYLGQFARYVLGQVDPDGELDPMESVAPISYIPGTQIPSPVPLPSLQRLYYKFGTPMNFADNQCNYKDKEVCMQFYQQLQNQVKQGIVELQEIRASDENNNFGSRTINAVKARFPLFETLN